MQRRHAAAAATHDHPRRVHRHDARRRPPTCMTTKPNIVVTGHRHRSAATTPTIPPTQIPSPSAPGRSSSPACRGARYTVCVDNGTTRRLRVSDTVTGVANTSYTTGNPVVNGIVGPLQRRRRDLRNRTMSDEPELLTARLRDERGFTLVEVMVALVIGLVVSTATLAIVIVSVHLGSNYTDRVDANQQGRLAMERITQALNSSCVTPNQPPVLAGSTVDVRSCSTARTNDTPGDRPERGHDLAPGTPGQPAPLTMSTQPLTGTAPNWAATSRRRRLHPRALGRAVGLRRQSRRRSSSTTDTASAGRSRRRRSRSAAAGSPPPRRPRPRRSRSTTRCCRPTTGAPTAAPSTSATAVVFRLTPPSSSANAANLPCT